MINGFYFKDKHVIHVYWEGVKGYTDENSEKIPNEDGVYEILVKQKGKNEYKRKYIGQTEDLQDRYYKHLSDEEENENIYEGVKKYICAFDYALIESEADRKDAEKGLYEKHNYPWNKTKPEGSGRNLDIEIIEHNL